MMSSRFQFSRRSSSGSLAWVAAVRIRTRRLSCATPVVSARRTGRYRRLHVSPPRDRPISCSLLPGCRLRAGARAQWTYQSFAPPSPRRTGTLNPKNSVEDAPVIYTRHATRLVRQERLDGGPFTVGEFVAHDSRLRFGSLNHAPGDAINLQRPIATDANTLILLPLSGA
jgi:hypothetical protein